MDENIQDNIVQEVIQEPLFVVVTDEDNKSYTFEVIQQDGCISQCMLLTEDEAIPTNYDQLSQQAIEVRENGCITETVLETIPEVIDVEPITESL
jgi:hypothetical protein